MPDICVGIWTVPTESKQWGVQPIDIRMRKLEAAIRVFERHALFAAVDANRAHGQTVTGIFLAPEYLFMNPFTPSGSTPDDGKQLEMFEVGQLRKNMETVTRGTRILVIPGTIASQARLDARSKREHLKVLQDHLRALDRSTLYSIYTRENIEDQKTAVASSLTKLRNAPTDGTHRIARNTAYGYLNGQQVLTYHKRTEVGEALDATTIFINGTEPGLLAVDGKRVGVEVCKDASRGYLRGLRDERRPDVQIVLSTDDHHQVQNNYSQFLVMATNAADDSGVYTALGRAVPTATVRVSGFNLAFKSITVA